MLLIHLSDDYKFFSLWTQHSVIASHNNSKLSPWSFTMREKLTPFAISYPQVVLIKTDNISYD